MGVTQCTHGENCNGYQPAEEKAYDVNGDNTIASDEKAYEITNAGQLYWFAAYVNDGATNSDNLKANAYLANDITINENLLSRIQTDAEGNITNDEDFWKWVSIGNYVSNNSLIYAGTFDGNNHSIKGIYINEANKKDQGIFGWIDGTVRLLKVKDSIIVGLWIVGGVVAQNAGTVKECEYAGKVFSEHKTYWAQVGGIAGSNSGVIDTCINYSDVTGYTGAIGGIAGDTYRKIKGCINHGYILNRYPQFHSSSRGGTGGIAGTSGYVDESVYLATITGCINTGEVLGATNSGKSAYAGGIVGWNDGVVIEKCFNNGNIKGGNSGGICGIQEKSGGKTCGKILNSYSTGVVESGYGICCITSNSDGSYVKNCCTTSSKVASINGNDTAAYTNVYYLSVDEDGKAFETDSCDGTTAMTAADFASGRVAYLLNQAQEADSETGVKPQVWYQNIDNDGTKASYPVLDSTHGTVYACTPCPSAFSNTAGTANAHVYQQYSEDDSKHICTNCGSTAAHAGVVYQADPTNADTILAFCSCGHSYGSIVLAVPDTDSLTYDADAKEAVIDTTNINGTLPDGVTINPSAADITYARVENGTATALTGGAKPTDAGTYRATLTVQKAAQPAVMPSATIDAANGCTTVSMVELIEGWSWEGSALTKALTVGEPVTATAHYNGADEGNYVTATATITITRSTCDHAHVELKNVVEATCTQTGFTGDTWCNDCQKTIVSGSVAAVDPNNHSALVTTITRQPTTQAEGERSFQCSDCGKSWTEPIAKLSGSSGGSSGGGGSFGGGSGSTTPATPDTSKKEPQIKGADGVGGWTAIREELAGAQGGSTVTIQMNGATAVPADTLAACGRAGCHPCIRAGRCVSRDRRRDASHVPFYRGQGLSGALCVDGHAASAACTPCGLLENQILILFRIGHR